jgi:hypothetical protein
MALAFAGCAPTTEWRLREINETSVKARGDDPNIVWEESVVIVTIDCPKEFPATVDVRNPRIESKGGPVISGVSATVAGSDEDYRREKWRRIYFQLPAARLAGLQEPTLKATISSRGFPDMPISYRFRKRTPNQSADRMPGSSAPGETDRH